MPGIIGTVTDANLAYYQLQYAPVDTEDWTVFATGTTQVVNGVLGTFDPTLLQNDEYRMRVVAVDANGLTTYKEIALNVSGNAKIGNFHLEYTDLNVPLAGIPIQVKRVYDTLQASESGDFGFGWTMSLLEGRIRETVPVNPQELSGDTLIVNPFKTGTKVYINTPDGKRVGFTFDPVAESTLLGTVFHPRLKADPGVYETLTVDDIPLSQRADGSFGLYLFKFPWNPQNYTLTTKDNVSYHYNQFSGLQSITDLNGNTLRVTKDGIFSDATGTSIQFVRDAAGRIKQIIDPAGHAINYEYDAAGNLLEVANQVGNESEYTYLASPAHYMSSANDPSCGCAMTSPGEFMAYGPDGRLSMVVDLLGNTVHQDYDLTHFTEHMQDELGKTTTLVYDDRGNIVSRTDPMGGVTTYVVDANDNVTDQTDPNTHTTHWSYDARGNITSRTDALNHTETWVYNAFNKADSYVDALGRTYTYSYDSHGNLIDTLDAAGGHTTATYDSSGRVLTATDTTNDTIHYAYGTGPNPTKITNPDGTFGQLEYDDLGSPTRFVNANGDEKVFTYDDAGVLQSMRDAQGNVFSVAFNSLNQLAK